MRSALRCSGSGSATSFVRRRYASWTPAVYPRVVVVLIEHGGFGAEVAAPAAREIYQTFFHCGETSSR